MAPSPAHRKSIGVPRAKSTKISGTNDEREPITLSLWIIKLQAGGVVIEGYRTVSANDASTLQNWRSTVIAHRVEQRLVQTHSGSLYRLKGGLDEDEAAEAGLPEELIDAFARGFPENWKELIDDYYKEEAIRRRRSSVGGAASAVDQSMNVTAKPKRQSLLINEPVEKRKGESRREADEDEVEVENDRDAQRRRSLNKRKSMLAKVVPSTPIQEEDEEEEEEEKEEETPKRVIRQPTRVIEMPTPLAPRFKTPIGRAPSSAKRTAKTPVESLKKKKEENEEEVFVTPEETPRTKASRRGGGRRAAEQSEDKEREDDNDIVPNASNAVVCLPDKRKTRTPRTDKNAQSSSSTPIAAPRRRGSGQREIPQELLDKSIPLRNWVLRFVRGGSPTSIYPHFQFKVCGFRPECEDSEWSTSCVQKVVPPSLMFTSSSIYRLDGQFDVDQASTMGFPPHFITDFLMGFPDDWEDKLEEFYNKTFGPPPPMQIVEVTSEAEAAVKPVEKKQPEKEGKRRASVDAKRQSVDGKRRREEDAEGDNEEEEEEEKEKKEEESSDSESSSSMEDSDDDYEKKLERDLMRAEKKARREEERAAREAERKKQAKEAKKKRFEVKVQTTPSGIPVSRSGRTLRTPMATWAGENVTYDSHGNAVEVTGVTTQSKLTQIKPSSAQRNEALAAHYGVSPAQITPNQKERALPSAPVASDLKSSKTPRNRKTPRRRLVDYSDSETEKIYFDQYRSMLQQQSSETPAFNMGKRKRKMRRVESSDSEAEAAERRREEKRRRRHERRQARESEEEAAQSEEERRRRRKTTVGRRKRDTESALPTSDEEDEKPARKKRVTVKKEKKAAAPKKPAQKRGGKKKHESEESDEDPNSDDFRNDDAVEFQPSDDDGAVAGGYSTDGGIQSAPDEDSEKKKKTTKKATKPRARAWKKEELIRLKLAIQAADPSKSADGWENIARSLGGDRTAEQCKKVARERLNLPTTKTTTFFDNADSENDDDDEDDAGVASGFSGVESGAASEDEEKQRRRKAKENDENRLKGVKAKMGTADYAVEMEQKKREMMVGSSSQPDDGVFDPADLRLSGVDALPSAAVFDPDDSLLECLDTLDVAPAPKPRATKRALQAAAPATPRLDELSSTFDDSPVSSATRRRGSTTFIPSPVVNQNDLTRYVHQLSRSKNMSMMSKSMAADKSRMMPPPVPKGRGGRIIDRSINAIDKATRKATAATRRKRDDEDLMEEDEENDDNLILADI